MAAALAAAVPVVVAGGPSAQAGAPNILTVTSGAPDGPGSLLEAFNTASDERGVRKIVVAPAVASGTITPASKLVFDGEQNLVFDGNGVTIDAQNSIAAAEGDTLQDAGIELLTAADVTIREISLEGAVQIGIRFEATGMQRAIRFKLFDVTIDSSFTAIQMEDNRGGRGMYLIANRLNISSSEIGVDLAVDSANASIDLNNTMIDAATVGIGVGQLGNGSLIAKLANTDVATDVFGVVLAETGSGDARVTFTNTTSVGVQGFAVSEGGAGHLRANVTNVEATGLQNGMTLREQGNGNLITRIRNFELVDSPSGVLDALVIDERGAGRLDATISKLTVAGPLGAAITGLDAKQEAPGVGRVRLSGSDLCGAVTPTDFSGVARVSEFNNLSGFADCVGVVAADI